MGRTGRIISLAAAMAIAAIAAPGCSERKSESTPIPRQRAYPRIEIAEPRYAPLAGLPLEMEANEAAEAKVSRESDGIVWLDLAYPRIKATVHYTFVAVDDGSRASVASNRAERMALNAGDNSSELTSLDTPGGFHGQMILTRRGSPTPVQSLAVGRDWVVSGAAYVDSSSPDSVAPIVDALAADMLHSLQTLK